MVKKINKDAVIIKELLKLGKKQSEIVELCGYKKQKVSYWATHEIKETKRRKKLKDIL